MSGAETSWKDLKPVLLGFTSTQMLGLVQDLYRINDQNASFMPARFLSERIQGDHLAPYKKRIRHAISPEQPWKQGVRLIEGRKAISEFKKANGNIRDTLTLMIYYVKCGNNSTLEFGGIDEAFYDSLGSMLSKITQTVLMQNDQKLLAEFLPTIEAEFHRVDTVVGLGVPRRIVRLPH